MNRCICGHNRRRHELPGFEGECVADACRCAEFRELVVLPPPPPESAQTPLRTAEQVLAAARSIDDTRVRAAVKAVEHLVAELRHRIYAERNRAASTPLRKVAEGGRRNTAGGGGAPVIPGGVPCEQCDRRFPTKQGAVLHRRRVHEGYDPIAEHKAATP